MALNDKAHYLRLWFGHTALCKLLRLNSAAQASWGGEYNRDEIKGNWLSVLALGPRKLNEMK
jgi:hypothetical protein